MKRAPKPPASVLLVGGNDRSMLAAARSLSRHEISFIVVGVTPRSPVGVSRSIRRHAVEPGPNARSDPGAYVEFLLDLVRRHDVQVVIPLTDRTLLACDRYRAAIEEEAPLAAPPSAAVRNVLDKRLHLRTAARLGIPCPEQFELESLDQVPELIDQLGFPIGLKNPGPSASGLRLFDFNWLVARNRQELDQYLAERCPPGSFPLVQRVVTGVVRNVCCFAVQGEVVATVEYRDIRHWQGWSVLREITPPTPVLQRHAERMLRELRWNGVAHLEFFVRESDGDVRYMETNGRLWASVEGPIAAGWDFPYWLYRYFLHGETPQPPASSQGAGQKSRWHCGDLQALLGLLSGGDEPTWGGRSRARAVADYLSGFGPDVHGDAFRLDDPLPELVEHWQAGTSAINRFRRRVLRPREWGLLPSRERLSNVRRR